VKRLLKRIWERFREGGTWQQLMAEPGNRPEYVTRVHAALRAQGIRSTYQIVGTGGGTPAGGLGSVSQTIKLLVHRDDYAEARRIMDRQGPR
jgi:hypothetical protein